MGCRRGSQSGAASCLTHRPTVEYHVGIDPPSWVTRVISVISDMQGTMRGRWGVVGLVSYWTCRHAGGIGVRRNHLL